MIEEKELKELVSLFEQSSLQIMEIEKKEGALRIRMEKGGGENAVPANPVKSAQPVSSEMQTAGQSDLKETVPCNELLEKVTAPLVGTFYAAPSPEDAPYVKAGQHVEKGQVLCLIEAMKMMNELKSPVSGTVKRISGENGKLAEFGQVLFEIEVQTC